ncbi:unnamed protein product [Gongylonema pulchrum]|uniref:Phospholysine phosphohistidine inorganic pyrophosphate phosphatase n=1 Tax=Gongylonema pulchrum TaxID=637853 RepID=A0A183DR84_9BILA|nr:unnamed protein product [Gongylonema pulchrum]
MDLSKKPVKGFLLDITGVLYNSAPDTPGVAIPAHAKLLGIVKQFEGIDTSNPNCVLMGIVKQFEDIDTSNPNCVLMGDAEEGFNYQTMNAAFRALLSMDNPLIITLGSGKFYQRLDGPCMDVGGFAQALKYACDARIVVIGKPDEQFFKAAVDDMGLTKDEVVMVGDDIVSDVGGAQKVGIRGVQVRTGKWRQSWINHDIKPDLLADDLHSVVNMLLSGKHV